MQHLVVRSLDALPNATLCVLCLVRGGAGCVVCGVLGRLHGVACGVLGRLHGIAGRGGGMCEALTGALLRACQVVVERLPVAPKQRAVVVLGGGGALDCLVRGGCSCVAGLEKGARVVVIPKLSTITCVTPSARRCFRAAHASAGIVEMSGSWSPRCCEKHVAQHARAASTLAARVSAGLWEPVTLSLT